MDPGLAGVVRGHMASGVLRFLRVEQGDLPRVLAFGLLAVLLQFGLNVGMSAGDAMFLSKVGADSLPVIYILMPFVMAVYTPVFSLLTGAMPVSRVMELAMGVLVAGGVGFWFLLDGGVALPSPWDQWAFYALRIYSAIWYIGLYTLFWNLADEYFDIQDGKRLFAILSAGTALGGVLAGGVMGPLAETVGVGTWYLVWAGTALLTLPVLRHIRNRLPALSESEGEEAPGGLAEQVRGIGQALVGNAYVPVLVTVFMLWLVLANINEYQYLNVLSQGRDENALAGLLGQLYGAANVVNLVINLFVFNRLVLRVGVRNVALVVPAFYLALFTFYFIDRGMAAALCGFIVLHGLVSSIDFNNANFLFNAIDGRYRKQVRTFVEGLGEPVVTCLTGVFLLATASALSAEALSAVGIGLAILLICLVLALGGLYRHSMIANLRKGWLDLTRGEAELLGPLGKDALEQLAMVASDPESAREDALFALRCLAEKAPGELLEPLVAFMARSDEEGRREAKPMLRLILGSGEVDAILAAVEALHREDLLRSPAVVEELGSFRLIDRTELGRLMSGAEAADQRGALLVPLWNSPESRDGLRALGMLDSLRVGEEAERCAAVRALGQLRQAQFSHLVAQFLEDRSPQVRREALLALKELGPLASTRLVPPVLATLDGATADMRVTAMEVLGSSGDPGSLRGVLLRTDGFTPLERRMAERMAIGMGTPAIPLLVSLLRDRNANVSGRAVAARALARLSLPQFQAIAHELVAGEIEQAYASLAKGAALAPRTDTSDGMYLLWRCYRDAERDGIDLALLLLCLNGDLPDFDLLLSSLRSPNPKVRGNALEALEQGVNRETYARLLPMVDGRPAEERLRARRVPPVADSEAILEAAATEGEGLLGAAAMQALWDLHPDRAAERLRQRLRPDRSDPLQSTLRELLHIERHRSDLTLVRRLAALARTDLFGDVSLRDLLPVASASESCLATDRLEIYEAGEPADSLFILHRGRATLAGPAGTHALEEGALFGTESLHGGRYVATATLEGAEIVVIPRGVLLAAAQTFPSLALRLLETRMSAA